MKYFRSCLLLLCCILAQGVSSQRNLLRQAENYFEIGKYRDALKIYNSVPKIEKKKKSLYKRGIANYHCNNLEEATRDITLAYNDGYDDKETYLMMGKIMHARGEFRDAVRFYKNYLKYVDKDDPKRYQTIDNIKRCRYGINQQFADQLAFVENMGASVNSEFDDFRPVQSPTSQNKYYFSSNRDGTNGGMRNAQGYKDEIFGNYSADMFAVELQDGNWTPIMAFDPVLNGPKNDIIQGFSTDGTAMFFLKSLTMNDGEMLVDTFKADTDAKTIPSIFESPMLPKIGDKDLQIFSDNTILFASNRQGGYGGYDLYIAQRDSGVWSEAINLGEDINSAYDEVSPHLGKSGTSLYFSSNRLESIGGYDIFNALYQTESGGWSSPTNLSFPVNSTKDDLHFYLSADGMSGTFSSNRPESFGALDLYIAYLKEQETYQLFYTQMVPFLNTTYSSDTASTSETTAAVQLTGKVRDFINSPLYYGNDENVLTPNNLLSLKRVKDLLLIYPSLEIIINSHAVPQGLAEFDLYFSIKRAEKVGEYFLSQGISANRVHLRGLGSNFPHTKVQNPNQISTLALKNNRRIEIAFLNIPADQLAITNEFPVAADFLLDGSSDRYNQKVKGLSYKVKVAKTKQMFKGDILKYYDSSIVEKPVGAQDYTYTIGIESTYNDAKRLKSEILRRGFPDAEIAVYIDGIEVAKDRVEDYLANHTDLANYLRFEGIE